MFYYIDFNGAVDSCYSNREDAVVSFKSLHATLRPNGKDAYGLHSCDGESDRLLTCSEDEWEADWWEAHHGDNWD